MRYTLLMILLLAGVIQSIAQDQRLLNAQWRMNELNLDGISNVPPSNSEVPFVTIDFDNPQGGIFVFWTCGGDLCQVDGSFIGVNSFETSSIVCLSGGCGTMTNQSFSSKYDRFFNNGTSPLFTYDIQSIQGNSLQLTITNGSGGFAVFTSTVASVEDQDKISADIFPVPARDKLYIEVNYDVKFSHAIIFDVQGKLVSKQKVDNDQIHISNLDAGRYFLVLQTDQEQSFRTSFLVK